jgi:hypothetical protein
MRTGNPYPTVIKSIKTIGWKKTLTGLLPVSVSVRKEDKKSSVSRGAR